MCDGGSMVRETNDRHYETLKTGLLRRILADYGTWQELIASVPDDHKLEPDSVGHWSVKDVIAHITVYERWTIEWLEPALRGDEPIWNYPDGEDTRSIDDRNARFYKQNRDRTLDDIQAEASSIHTDLLSVIERVPEEAFGAIIGEYAPPVGAYYRNEATVHEAIDDNSAAHYRHHTTDLQRWLQS
jgi:hypothetical protein